jgi:putative salt-induced outer membrane protein YdiY
MKPVGIGIAPENSRCSRTFLTGESMKLLSWCFIAIILVASNFARADVVTLQNGDRVTGAIVKKDGDTVTFESTHFGAITFSWDQVQSLTTEQPIHVVAGGQEVQGVLSITGGRAEVGGRSLALAEVTAIRNDAQQQAYERLLAPGWLDVWAGAASLALAGTTGNAQAQTFTTAANAARVTNSDKTTLSFSAIRGSALVDGVKSTTAQAVRGGVGYNRNVTPRLFVSVFNDYEYDRFQSLDLRFVLGGGLGYSLIKSERTIWDLLGGMAYNREKFSTPLTRNSAEAYWGYEFNYQLTSVTTFFQNYRMFNNLNDTENFRINADLGLSSRLNTWLTWNLNLSDRYLRRPTFGRKTNDLLYSTGLGITFAR